MNQPDYANEIEFHEVNLAPVNESALDMEFVTDNSMWEWYGNVMSCLGSMTISLAKETPEEMRFAFLKLPFEYDMSEMER